MKPKKQLVNLTIDAVALCAQGMNPLADVVLFKSKDAVDKATTIPNPDLREQPFRPQPEAGINVVRLEAERALRVLINSGRLASSNRLEREAASSEFKTLRALLSEGNGADSMREQAAGQRRNGVGVDSGTTTWDGRSIRTNADGSKTKVTTKADVADLLRTARLAKQLSQAALAKSANVSERSVRSHEAGDSVPSPLVACRLAAALDLDADQRDRFAVALSELRRG